MNDKVYNRCLRIARLACDNTRRELSTVSRIPADSIQVLVRGKETLASYVEKIMKNGTNAVVIYRSRIQPILHIECEDPRLQNASKAGEMFVKSVLKSREARLCQKRIIDLTAAEIYFQQAALYDKHNPYVQTASSAMEYAKNVVSGKYSKEFLKSFDFGETPKIKGNILTVLQDQAFDTKYAFGTMNNSVAVANQLYEKEYVSRRDYFISSKGVAVSTRTGQIPSVKDRVFTLESLIIADLYKGAFAHIAAKNKIRRFTNLRAKNRDIEICPPRNLTVKRQFSTVDAMTMHRFIYNYYTDNKPDNVVGADVGIYYFKCEIDMYKCMWGETASVSYKGGRLYFTDGTVVDVPAGVAPHEGLHRVNAAYGALFGFTPDDMGGDWLYNSVRQAYTSEGIAEYRLAMIDAKLKGRLK